MESAGLGVEVKDGKGVIAGCGKYVCSGIGGFELSGVLIVKLRNPAMSTARATAKPAINEVRIIGFHL